MLNNLFKSIKSKFTKKKETKIQQHLDWKTEDIHLNLNQLSTEIHDLKFLHQNEGPQTFHHLCMKIILEISTAVDHQQNDKKSENEFLGDLLKMSKMEMDRSYRICYERNIKDSVEEKLASSIINLLDMCAYMDIDIDNHIKAKLIYQKILNEKKKS